MALRCGTTCSPGGSVGWAMKAEMTAQFATDALIIAIWSRGRPDGLLHHSNHGS